VVEQASAGDIDMAAHARDARSLFSRRFAGSQGKGVMAQCSAALSLVKD
jgi:hypothetical protein